MFSLSEKIKRRKLAMEKKLRARKKLASRSREKGKVVQSKPAAHIPIYTCAEYQHPKFIASQAVHTRSKKAESAAKGEFLNQIQKLANDKSIILGPEAVNACNRNRDARSEESIGHIHLHVISNFATKPVSDEILAWLVGLRNIVSEELPHMNRSYISKLVFDPRHKNLVLVEKEDVIGGICFQMFPAQKFSEIVFLAVTLDKHRHGYGTHLMNHLKDYHVKHNIFILLTYAANEAIGFFEKQGFSEVVPEAVEKKRGKDDVIEPFYEGYINLYHGAKLMQCRLEKMVVYTEFSELVSRQKKVLISLLETLHTSPSKSSQRVQ